MADKNQYTRRSQSTTSLKEGVEALLDAYKLRSRFDETYVIAYWEKLMGSHIAAKTKEIFVKNKKLFLKLDSAPLKNELSLSKTKMLEIINREHEEEVIVDIIFL